MSKIEWRKPGTRYYDHGLDRGVLYPYDGPGVPWNGLVSVEETPTGGDVNPYYLDGLNYHNDPLVADFKANIKAITYPDEFEPMQGVSDLSKGFLLGEQPRKPFGLSYRTFVGNDTRGDRHEYKIHILSGCIATPSEKVNGTNTETVEVEPFSWDILATPQKFSGYKPATHITVDTRKSGPYAAREIEKILYGTEDSDPRLITPSELLEFIDIVGVLEVFEHYHPLFPTYEIFGLDSAIQMINAEEYVMTWPSITHPFNGDDEIFQAESF